MIVLLGFLASTMMAAASDTQTLCGRTYETVTQLGKELGADKDVAHFPGKNGLTTFYDRRAMTLWWIYSRRGHAGFAMCKRKITTDAGYTGGRVEADCNGDRSGRCTVQAQRMVAVKF
jgi:hypothetical protein